MSQEPDVYATAPYRKRRRHRPGTVNSAKSALWNAIIRIEEAYRTETDSEKLLRFGHCMLQATAAYARVCEATDLAQRIKRVEKQLAEERGDG